MQIWKNLKPVKINNIVENYAKREKTAFPPFKPPTNYSKKKTLIGIDNNLKQTIKKKLKGICISVVKQPVCEAGDDVLDEDRMVAEYEKRA